MTGSISETSRNGVAWQALRLRGAIMYTCLLITGVFLLASSVSHADHNSLHVTPCNEADTVGGGTLGNSPGPVGPPTSLGWDVGGGQCNGSFTVTRDTAFPSADGDGIELGLRAEERRVGQVTNGGGDYEVETGNDANAPPAVNRAWWNFHLSISYDGNITDLDALIFTIRTDVGANLPVSPAFDMLFLRPFIDARNNQPNATATYSDLYQVSHNPEFGWFTNPADDDANPDGDFDYDEEGAWRLTLWAIENGQTASASVCIHTPGAACNPEKESVCHKGKKTLSIGPAAVPAHLAHGDFIGACD